MTESANTALRDVTVASQVDLTRLQQPVVDEVRAILLELERDMTAQLVRTDPTEPKRARYRRERLEKLLRDVRASAAASYADAGRTSGRANTAAAAVENRTVQNALNAVFAFDLGQPYLERNDLVELALNTLIEGAPSREWWSGQRAGMVRDFAREMRSGMLAGETLGQLVDRVGPIFHGPNGNSGKQLEAESLVRTSMIAVGNASRFRTYKENEDVLKGIQWVSTLDSRTTDICKGLDGLVWDMDLQPIDHNVSFPGFTAHWQCRSTQTGVLKSLSELAADQSEEARRIAAEVDARDVPGTRSSLDGAIPATTTYEDWLRERERRDPGWAVRSGALTQGRYDLWVAGRLEFRDLIDQTANALTTAEILARVGAPEDFVASLAAPRMLAPPPDVDAAAAFELPSLPPIAGRNLDDRAPGGDRGRVVARITSKHLSGESLTASEQRFVRAMTRTEFRDFNIRMQRLRDNLAGYARSVLAGVKPSTAQQRAYDMLTPGGKKRLDDRINAARTENMQENA